MKYPPSTAINSIPRATYRLQLQRDFSFIDAAQIVPYLAQLGISHCYTSPILTSRAGSEHGYDIVMHGEIDPELGGHEGFLHFTDVLHRHNMGLIVDVVPNHMGIMGHDNLWWLDVLENGRASLYASFFDINWQPLKRELKGKILVPVLGDQYGAVLDSGELTLRFNKERGSFAVWYHDHLFPLDPTTYPMILNRRLYVLVEPTVEPTVEHSVEQSAEQFIESRQQIFQFTTLISALQNLPSRNKTTKLIQIERATNKWVLQYQLADMYRSNSLVARYIDDLVMEINQETLHAVDTLSLHSIMEAQAWRLASWRVAADDINYRRFLDINELAALQMNNETVFAATHRLLFNFIAEGRIQGIRIDHTDGLSDPQAYFTRIRTELCDIQTHISADTTIKSPVSCYVVIEKVLSHQEKIPPDWPIDGTTGYDFSSYCNALFIDKVSIQSLQHCYFSFTGKQLYSNEIFYQCKKLIMRVAMSSELNVLANQLGAIAEKDTHTRDFTINALREALSETIACFTVYRTYIRRADGNFSDLNPAENACYCIRSQQDIYFIDQAIASAKHRSLGDDTSIFDFLRNALLAILNKDDNQTYRDTVITFATRFQQYASAVMAKGWEDTAFYRYNLLLSLNEVGESAGNLGATLVNFHNTNQERLASHPYSMLAGSTHDSKRSEDVRARINVLSELPEVWCQNLNVWHNINKSALAHLETGPAPSRNDEYLFYQTIIGTWPKKLHDQTELDQYCERIKNYMLKAIREAKQHTSWRNPNHAYEQAVHQYVDAVIGTFENNAFLAEFMPFQQRICQLGLYNSLSQTLLRLTAPGVPDIYQGNEAFNFSLVDPDNRSPVDFQLCNALLQELNQQSGQALKNGATHVETNLVTELLNDMADGRVKLYLIKTILGFRAQYTDLFCRGDYEPLRVVGDRAKHLCSFSRRLAITNQSTQAGGAHSSTLRGTLIVLATRFFVELLNDKPYSSVGKNIWNNTFVFLPDEKLEQAAVSETVHDPAHYNNQQNQERCFLELLTNTRVSTVVHENNTAIPVANVLANFPVAVLFEQFD